MNQTCDHVMARAADGTCLLCDAAPRDNASALASVAPALWRAELARRDFATFFRDGWSVLEPSTPLLWSWPYEEVCRHLQTLVEDWAARQRDPGFVQRLRNLLVTLPPGCLKSRLLSYLVPWAWLRWPELRAIALSCNPRVALRDSMYSRDVIASEWYQRSFAPTWRVRVDSDAKGLYSNDAGGFRAAMGFDARIVGERGDLIIVDDPHDPDEAESDAQREHVHDRWESSIGNRVNDLGSSVRVGIAQRTHEDDWSARRIREGWAHLDLPMLHEPERACVTALGPADPRTVDGECLHPERFPPEVIEAERRRVGERRWATLYQGRPAPRAGAIVQTSWLRFWRRAGKPDASAMRPSGCWRAPAVELPRSFDSVCIAADLAGGKRTERGDFNVIVAVGRSGADFFLLECWRERAGFPEVQRKYREVARRYPTARKVVEQQASGASLVASLQREISGLVGVPSRDGKVERLESVLQFFEAGNVHLDENWPWLGGAVAEITSVPNSRFDDFTDALVLAISQLVGGVVDPELEDKRRTFERNVRVLYADRYAGKRERDLRIELAMRNFDARQCGGAELSFDQFLDERAAEEAAANNEAPEEEPEPPRSRWHRTDEERERARQKDRAQEMRELISRGLGGLEFRGYRP